MVPALHSEESMGQLRSKSGTGKHFVHIPGNGAKRQLISGRVDVHYQGTGGYRSPRAGFLEYFKVFQQFVEKSSVWRKLEENQDFWRHDHDFFGDSQSITNDSKTLSFMLNYLVVSSYNTGSCWRTQLPREHRAQPCVVATPPAVSGCFTIYLTN